MNGLKHPVSCTMRPINVNAHRQVECYTPFFLVVHVSQERCTTHTTPRANRKKHTFVYSLPTPCPRYIIHPRRAQRIRPSTLPAILRSPRRGISSPLLTPPAAPQPCARSPSPSPPAAPACASSRASPAAPPSAARPATPVATSALWALGMGSTWVLARPPARRALAVPVSPLKYSAADRAGSADGAGGDIGLERARLWE